jgi:hypothetical protein
MLRTALVLLLLLVATVAQGQESSLTTIPSPPVAGSPFVIDAAFLGGGTPTAAFLFSYVSGGDIAISGVPASPPVFGHVQVTVPAMQAGTYLLQFTTVGFSPRPDYANFQLVVAPQGVALASVPMLEFGALLLCAFAIALAGGAALMRRRIRRKLLS